VGSSCIRGRASFERADTNLFAAAVGPGGVIGFGNPNVNNLGCGSVTAASFSTVGPNNCVAINKEVDIVTVGFWQNLFKGSYGRVAAGLQWEYIQRKSFTQLRPTPRAPWAAAPCRRATTCS